jgi:hypothetical protein
MTVAQAGAQPANDDRDDETPIEPARRAELLQDCQQFVIARLSDAIAEALTKVGDDLTALALRNTNPDAQQALLDAVTLVRRRHGEIQTNFRELFSDVFVQRVHGLSEDGGAEPAGGLALVDDSVIEEKIAIDRIVQRVRSKLDPDEVLGIRARLGVLAAGDWFDETRHPASPEAVFEALRQTLAQLDADQGVRDALLDAIEPHVSSNLGAIYTTVNERLRDNRVLPRIRPRIVGARAAPAPAAPKAPAPEALPSQMGREQEGRDQASKEQGVAPFPAIDRAAGLAQQASQGAAFPAGRDEASPPATAELLAALLDGLQRGAPQARQDALGVLADSVRLAELSSAAPASFGLVQSLHAIQMGTQGGADELLAEGRRKGSALDQVTIELVAVLFDRLYADRRLPDPVKQQLLRLQVLAVKAALIDRGFFARGDHPMRRLLDSICRAASDPDADVRPDSPLVVGIAEIVDWLVASFDTELSVFSDALSRLDLLLSIEAQRRTDRNNLLARQAERLEALAMAQDRARAEVLARTGDAVPVFVNDFLERHWTRSMVAARAVAGEQGWREALACMEALLWSVAPKATAEVSRLAGLLPKLIAELNRGLGRIETDKAERERFFNELLKRHTEVIQHARGESVTPPSRFVVPPQPVRGPDAPGTSDALDGPDSRRPSGGGVSPEVSRKLTALSVGDMVELLEPDGSRRVFRVSWLSANRRLFVLTRFPDDARTIRREELVRWFATGRIRTVVPDSAIERTIASLLSDRNDGG